MKTNYKCLCIIYCNYGKYASALFLDPVLVEYSIEDVELALFSGCLSSGKTVKVNGLMKDNRLSKVRAPKQSLFGPLLPFICSSFMFAFFRQLSDVLHADVTMLTYDNMSHEKFINITDRNLGKFIEWVFSDRLTDKFCKVFLHNAWI